MSVFANLYYNHYRIIYGGYDAYIICLYLLCCLLNRTYCLGHVMCSIIHSAIEAQDTSVIAQMGWPDMRLPLLYSIAWPARVSMPWKSLDLAAVGTMTFKAPDYEKYPCIPLAYAAGRTGGSMTAALNAANERANELFRSEKLGYLGIPKAVEMVMEQHKKDLMMEPSLEDIVQVDVWARAAVDAALAKVNSIYTINV